MPIRLISEQAGKQGETERRGDKGTAAGVNPEVAGSRAVGSQVESVLLRIARPSRLSPRKIRTEASSPAMCVPRNRKMDPDSMAGVSTPARMGVAARENCTSPK